MADLKDLEQRLRRSGCDQGLLNEVMQALQSANVEETEGRIIRTNKGALMVRLSPTRWPIGMYAKDWRLLLKLVPAIEHALETMDILEENPEKSERQIKQIRSVRAAQASTQLRDRTMIRDEEDEEEVA